MSSTADLGAVMSEAEFDSYLSLMAKFLRLRSRQKDALADELRDHLESRLDELLAQGKTREQAVSIALEEFGDAAVLAEDFSRLASRHTRRFVMRCTAASAVVVAAVVLLTLAVAPPVPDGAGPPPLVAQDAAPGGEPAADAVPAIPETPSIQQEAIAALDAKLDKVIPEINFVELPPPDMPGALASKAIDAYFIGEPHAARAELDGTGRILYHAKDIWPQFISCVLVVTEELIATRPGVVQDLVRGIAESGEWAEGHRLDAAKLGRAP